MQKSRKFIPFLLPALIFVSTCCLVCSQPEIDSGDNIEKIYKDSIKAFKQKNWEQAVEGFEKVINIAPEYKNVSGYFGKSKKKLAESYYDQGLGLLKSKKLDDAIEKFRKSTEYDFEYQYKGSKKIGEIYAEKAQDCYNQGKFDESIENLKQSINYDVETKPRYESKIAEFYHEHGINFFANGDYEDAIDNLNLALEYERDRNTRRKISTYLDRAKRNLAEHYFNTGKNSYNDGKFLEAYRYFLKSESYDRFYPRVNEYITSVKAKMREKAKELYLEGLKEYSMDDKRKAIELWEMTLRYDPKHVKAQISLDRTKAELNIK